MGKKRNAWGALVGKPREVDYLEDLHIDGRIL